MKILSIAILILSLSVLGLSERMPIFSANSQGNFTQQQITTIQNIISAAEDQYGKQNLNGIAKLISQYITKLYKKCWSVYVYDENTKNGTFSARITSDKWIKWFSYGKYSFTYFTIFDTSIFDGVNIGNKDTGSISFGKDINSTQQTYIINLVNDTTIYKGQNMDTNAQYIRSKLSPGNWNVYIIESNTTSMGGYQCRRGQNWGILQKFGRFKWNYYIQRSY